MSSKIEQLMLLLGESALIKNIHSDFKHHKFSLK